MQAGERLLGVLPLFRETLPLCAGRLRVVRLVGCDHTLDAAGLAIEPAWIELALRRILDQLGEGGPWDLLHLGPLRHYVTASERLRDAAAGHCQVQAVIHGGCDNWITQFDLPATYETYLEGLSPVDRSNLLRRERRLHSQQPVQVTVAREPSEVQRAMDALVRLHQRLWTGKGQQGVFTDWPAYERFHRDAAERFARDRRLVLIALETGGEIFATTYGYHFGDRTHSMISGYVDDAQWRRYGLGRLLHCLMSREAIGHGSAIIDDGRGLFEHKIRMGGRVFGERSVAVLRRGWTRRLRFWAALRGAYLTHVLYCRIWFDQVAPRLGLRRPLRPFYIHSSFLAHLFRRSRFGLLAGPVVQEASRMPSPPQQPSSKE